MIKSMNIAWWVQHWAELTPDKMAVIFKSQFPRTSLGKIRKGQLA